MQIMYNVVKHGIILYNKKVETVFMSHNREMAKNYATFRQ